MSKKKKDDLPDYTVADMNVEGMPWNSRRHWQILPGDPAKKKNHREPSAENNPFGAPEQLPMTPSERRTAVWLALKAALLVAAVFGGAAFLFILFCVYVWF